MISALRKLLASIAVMFSLAGGATAQQSVQILAMGDSLMSSHRISKRAIPNVISEVLGVPVVDRSVAGARILYKLPISGSMGFNISKQYRPGNWDWIVLSGGGNDLWLGCGCRRCDKKINRLIAHDGRRGEIPRLVQKLRRTGAQVIYVGYLRSPGVGSPIEHCRDEGDELERRINTLAGLDWGFHFVSLADMVPRGDRSFHAVDMIHPSLKGSRSIGMRIARVIAQ